MRSAHQIIEAQQAVATLEREAVPRCGADLDERRHARVGDPADLDARQGRGLQASGGGEVALVE